MNKIALIFKKFGIIDPKKECLVSISNFLY